MKLYFCHFWFLFEVEGLRKKKTLAEVSVKGSWKSKPISELEWSLPPA